MTALLSIGLRAMTANYAALQTTGHNIANAGVEGYSRQSVEFATSKGQFTGAGFFGKGVDVANITRAHDKFLSMQAVVARSLAALDRSRADQLSRLEGVFPPGETGLGYAISDFLNAMGDVATNPADLSARQVVLSRANEVTSRFNTAYNDLDALQVGVTQDIGIAVDQVNELSQRIANLNDQIARYNGGNIAPNDLLDARDQAISDLGELVQITTLPASDGSVGVFLGGGQRLVLGNEVQPLVLMPHPMDPQRVSIGMRAGGAMLELSDDLFTGGTISGLLRFQNEDLVDARNLIGQMALSLSLRVNEAQAAGLDLLGNNGAPIFSAGLNTGLPRALPDVNNARGADGEYIARVDLRITDASAVQASDYEMVPHPSGIPGQYLMTRLSDGVPFTVVDGQEVDGMTIEIETPLQAGDRLLLRPVAAGAAGMEVMIDDPRGLAAALPVTATMGVDNTGTATVNTLIATDEVDPGREATFTFTGAATDTTREYTWTLSNPSETGTGVWTAGQPIELNGFELSLNGVPAENDTLTVGETTQFDESNGNAQALLALRDETFVGRVDGEGGVTITDAYATAMSDIGVRTQSAQVSASIAESAYDQARMAKLSQSGVNLDEEAARLIQFQQAYQAAAKVLQVAQSVFDTMLQVGGG